MNYVDELAAWSFFNNNLERAREQWGPDSDALKEFLEDMSKAKAAMDAAYLELIPTQGEA